MPDSPIGRAIATPSSLRGHVVVGVATVNTRNWLITDMRAAAVPGAYVAVEAHRVTLAPLPEWQGVSPDFTGSEP